VHVVASQEAVPWAPFVEPVTERESLSRSVSFGRRDVVHRGHRDLDVGGVRPTLAVGDRVLERVEALEVRFRGVGAEAADRARDRAVVGRRLERLEGERIAVVVGVVGEDVDAVRRVLGERERVFGRARLLVRRHDLDGDVPDVGCHPGRRTPCT